MKVYFDNAATTYPKPESVADAVYDYIKNNGANIGRGIYKSALSAAEKVYETRELIAELFNAENTDNVIFTANVTEALNMVIKGFLKPGDHVLVSSMEHNAVMRPLTQLLDYGITFERIPSEKNGTMCEDMIAPLIKSNTKAIITTHASNVCGTIMPIEKIGGICRKYGLKFIVDTAQTAGTEKIDMQKCNISALCFTGHKGLYGPQGTGGFVLTDEMAEMLEPLISGGTGSISDKETVPDFCPDKFEAGTLNILGIYGLNEGIRFINSVGIDNIKRHELMLTEQFIMGINRLDTLKIAGINGTENRTAVVSIVGNDTKRDMSELAAYLEKCGIMLRIGMHCAPNAHKILGTFPSGTLRFSFGYFNKPEEVDYTLECMENFE